MTRQEYQVLESLVQEGRKAIDTLYTKQERIDTIAETSNDYDNYDKEHLDAYAECVSDYRQILRKLDDFLVQCKVSPREER